MGVADELAGELPVAVIQTTRTLHHSHAEMQQRVVCELGQDCAPQWILNLQDDLGHQSFPVTVSGKIEKNVLKQLVE